MAAAGGPAAAGGGDARPRRELRDADLGTARLARVFKRGGEGGDGGGRVGRVNSLDFHRRGVGIAAEDLLAAAWDDGALMVVDTARGKAVVTLTSKYGCRAVRFTHHPKALLYASQGGGTGDALRDNAVRHHSLYDNSYLQYFEGHRSQVTGISLSPVSEGFLSSSVDGTVLMWDLRSSKPLREIDCRYCPKTKRPLAGGHAPLAMYDGAGEVLALGLPGGQIRLYDAEKPESGPFCQVQIPQEQGHARAMTHLQFSPCSNHILCVIESKIYVLQAYEPCDVVHEFSSGEPTPEAEALGHALGLPQANPPEAAFSACGRYVVSGCQDKAVRAWSLESGREVGCWAGHAAAPRSVAWAPGRALVASACHAVALWTL